MLCRHPTRPGQGGCRIERCRRIKTVVLCDSPRLVGRFELLNYPLGRLNVSTRYLIVSRRPIRRRFPLSDLVAYCSCAVVAIRSDWLAFHVRALAAARTALPLPRSLRRKLTPAAATRTQIALTVSRLSHASPRAQKREMTHLLQIYVVS